MYSSRRRLYLSSRCCSASVMSRLAIRSPAPGRSRPAGSSTKKQTRIPPSRCTSRRTGAARRSPVVQAARERRHPRGIPPPAPLGDPPWYRLRVRTGLTARFRRLAGQRLVQLAPGRGLHDPARPGQQVSPAHRRTRAAQPARRPPHPRSARAASRDVPPRPRSGQLADACRSRVLVSSRLQGGAGPAREGDRPTQVRRRGADNRSAAQRVIQGRAGIVWVAVRPGG
jgi:hypothetical protein